jgi:acetyl-CoA C-acetyltransferase
MSQREVVILSGVRTAIGDYGGSLKDFPPSDLGAKVIREAVARAKVDPADVSQVVIGNVIHTEPKDMYISRVCAVNGGLPHDTGAMTVNRLCGSGLQAIVSAAQYILLGEADCTIGGGTESMSRALYGSSTQRWGARYGRRQDDGHDDRRSHRSFRHGAHGHHRGERRGEVQLHARRAGRVRGGEPSPRNKAAAAGLFKDQILPIEIKSKKGVVMYDTDEHVRADASVEGMGKLKAVFQKDGTVTAGNASGINDAAAAVVMMERAAAEKRGLKPMARLVSYGHAGIDPKIMGLGPVSAVKRALERAGLKIGDLDVIESNEAFAAQAMGVSKELGLDGAKVNPNGGAVALGHPIGATGCILTIKAMYELRRTGGRYGLITMCIGGGQGIAAIIERL